MIIHNTNFNNLSGNTSRGQKTEFVSSCLLGNAIAEQKKNKFMVLNLTTYNLSIDEFLNRYTLSGFNIIPNNLYNQTIYFGNDSLEFANYLSKLLGLTNDIIGVTNIREIDINNSMINPNVLTKNIYLSSNNNTYNYVSYKTTTGNITSNLLTLFSASTPNAGKLIITANFSNNNLIGINFTRTP